MTKLGLVSLLLILSGCDGGGPSPPDTRSDALIELGELLPPDAVVVGTTIAPDGKHYVLDQRSGLYELHDSSATLVFNTTGLSGVELTDVVALDSWRFALTAENDGFLLDTRTGGVSSYFCYLPSLPAEPGAQAQGGSPGLVPPLSVSQTLQQEGVAVKQRTESVAFNVSTGQLFAQPRTIRLDDGAIAGSELFVFDQGGGEPVRVLPFGDPTFVAGGMVVLAGDRLLLGAQSSLFEMTRIRDMRPLQKLSDAVDISGMTADAAGNVWIVDRVARQLVNLGAF